MEEARVAIVPVGVLSTEEFLGLDTQPAGRCPIKEYSRLNYWEFPDITPNMLEGLNNNSQIERKMFRNLLKGFESFLPFPEPSELYSRNMAELIFEKVKFTKIEEGPYGKTNIRKIAWFLRQVGDLALSRNHYRIEEIDIRDAIL